MDHIQVIINNQKTSHPKGVLLLDVIKQLFPQKEKTILGCLYKGEVLELDTRLEKDITLEALTYAHEEGKRIYERSIRFVLLMALEKRFPNTSMRVLNSIGNGLSGKLLEQVVARDQVLQLKEEMERIVKADLPFTKEVWSKEAAIDYFRKKGQKDKVQLLVYRPYEYFPMYCCGDVKEYFYGAMAPSTGWTDVFDLKPLFPGWVLQLPGEGEPQKPAVYHQRPKFQSVFAESQRWCNILEAENAADINKMIGKKEVREFIRINEALHDRSISDIADAIVQKNSRLVFVAGPSSSGKTTFTNRLRIHLQVLGKDPVLVSLDDFYLNRDQLPYQEDGSQDLEHINTLDIPFFANCLEQLIAGETVGMPRFNFHTGKREDTLVPLKINENQPILIEGIHGLNPMLSEEFTDDMLYRIYVSALTCINLDNHNRIRTTDVRLLRRIVRDHQFRGTSPEETLAMWDSVRAGEEKWIFPYQELADVMMNTTLHYELPVLKSKGYEILRSITKESPQYLPSRRLLKILHYFSTLPAQTMEEIPPLSILREFIGGSTFYGEK